MRNVLRIILSIRPRSERWSFEAGSAKLLAGIFELHWRWPGIPWSGNFLSGDWKRAKWAKRGKHGRGERAGARCVVPLQPTVVTCSAGEPQGREIKANLEKSEAVAFA